MFLCLVLMLMLINLCYAYCTSVNQALKDIVINNVLKISRSKPSNYYSNSLIP